MDDIKYLGKGCKHGHHNEQGESIRYKKSKNCVECDRKTQQQLRGNRAAEYKAYQREYHQRLRESNPEKLEQYRQTQVDKGNDSKKYHKAKKCKNLD